MASIDKTYTSSYKEYIELINWAKTTKIRYYTGQIDSVYNYVYRDYNENDFDNETKLPVMNTSESIDIFIIQNCQIDFVKKRLKSVYGEKTYNKMLNNKSYTEKPEEFEKGRKIIITNYKGTKLPLYNKGINSHKFFWLQGCKNNELWFDRYFKVWVDNSLPNNTNTSVHKTIKSLIRFLRKQYLPKNIEFKLSGRYVGENYIIKIK